MPQGKKRPKVTCRFVGGPKDGTLQRFDKDGPGTPKEEMRIETEHGLKATYRRVMYRSYSDGSATALYAPDGKEFSALWQALNQRYNPTDLTDALKRTNYALRKMWSESNPKGLPQDAIQAALDAGDLANAVLQSYKQKPVPENHEFIPINP